MTTFVHCMICFTFPVPDLKFFLSGCGHVACFNCVQKGSMTLKCKVCQRDNPQILEINRNLKPELRDLFTPLTSGFSKIARDVGHAFDFQNGHRQRLIRHLQAKSCNFDKLQQFCKDEIRKKNQYKQDLLRIKAEYKKKCEEAMELKAKIANISNRTTSIGDTSNNPFRTPTCGAKVPHRSFITSTPYSHSINSADISDSAAFPINRTNSSTSFATAGIPLVSMDSGGEKSVRSGKDCIQQDKLATSNAHFMGKIPASKKTKLDLISKTQPLPLKSI